MSKVVVPVLLLMLSLGGCASSQNKKSHVSLGMRGIPQSAKLLRDGHGSMSLRASSMGRVYVYDADDDVIAWTGTLNKDQRLSIDPGDNRIMVDQSEAYHRILDPDHTHQIYFEAVK